MISRQGVLKRISLLLVVSLLLVACERPLQDTGEEAEDLATDVAEEVGEAVTRASEEGEATEETTPPDEAEGAVGTEAETPTPEDEEEPTAIPTEVTEEEATPEVDETAEAEDEEASPRPEDESEAEETAEDEEAEEAAEDEEVSEEEASEEEASEEEAAEEEAAEEEVAEAEEEEAEAEEETEAEEAEETEAASQERIHVVKAGENLYRIGLQYGVSWVVLAEYNNLSNARVISPGQQIKIPLRTDTGNATPTPTPSPATETTYIVKAGDNLYRIGRMFNVSWVQIAEANGIVNPNQIFVGQELKIPSTAPGPSPQFTHTVQRGETLFTISLRYGVAWTTIAETNNLSSPYVIYPGQTLAVPGG